MLFIILERSPALSLRPPTSALEFSQGVINSLLDPNLLQSLLSLSTACGLSSAFCEELFSEIRHNFWLPKIEFNIASIFLKSLALDSLSILKTPARRKNLDPLIMLLTSAGREGSVLATKQRFIAQMMINSCCLRGK